MGDLYQVLFVVGAGLAVWLMYRYVRRRPEQFTSAVLFRSLSTMGGLAICLIVFIALLVVGLKQ